MRKKVMHDRHVEADINKMDPLYVGSGSSVHSRRASKPRIVLDGEVVRRPLQAQTIEHQIAFLNFEVRRFLCELRIETNRVKLEKLREQIEIKSRQLEEIEKQQRNMEKQND